MDNPAYDQLTFRQMSQYHVELREALYMFLKEEYMAYGCTFSEISAANAAEADLWKEKWSKPNRKASWSWGKLYREYRSRPAARRFDIAVHKSGQLQGLCYGMLDRNRFILKLHAVERSPTSKSLAGGILKMVFAAADYYAMLNETHEIWVCDPVSPAHVRMYQSKGYEAVRNWRDDVTHLARRIK
ncbi:MAG: hypothetical protein ACI93R_003946 [Flavobacteriales bacterium]|jgi:hypothetical protein